MPKLKLPSTLAFLGGIAVIGTAYEYVVVGDKIHGNSISAALRKIGEAQPALPLAFGALMRHLFGQAPCREAFLTGWMAGEFWPLIDKEITPESEPNP